MDKLAYITYNKLELFLEKTASQDHPGLRQYLANGYRNGNSWTPFSTAGINKTARLNNIQRQMKRGYKMYQKVYPSARGSLVEMAMKENPGGAARNLFVNSSRDAYKLEEKASILRDKLLNAHDKAGWDATKKRFTFAPKAEYNQMIAKRDRLADMHERARLVANSAERRKKQFLEIENRVGIAPYPFSH